MISARISKPPQECSQKSAQRRMTPSTRGIPRAADKKRGNTMREKSRGRIFKLKLITPANLEDLAVIRHNLRESVKLMDTKFSIPWEDAQGAADQDLHHVQAATSVEMLKAALAEDESQVALLPTPGESRTSSPMEPASRAPQSPVSESALPQTLVPPLGRHGGSGDAPPMDTVIFDESGDSAAEQSVLDRSEPPPGSDDRGDDTVSRSESVSSFATRGKTITGLHMRQRLKNIFNKDRRGSNGNESTTSGGGAASIPVVPLLTSVPFSRTPCVLQLSEMSLPSDCVVSQLTVCGSCGDIAAGCISGEIYLWTREYGSVYTKNAETILKGHVDSISCLHWAARGQLISCSLDASTCIWMPRESKRPVYTLRHFAHSSSPSSKGTLIPTYASTAPAAKDSNKRFLMIACADGTIEIYSMAENAREQPHLRHRVKIDQMATCVALSPDGSQIAVGSAVGTVSLFLMKSLRGEGVFDCRNRAGKLRNGRKVTSIQWDASGQRLLVCCGDSRVRIVHLRDLSKRTKFKSSLYYTNQSMMLMATWSAGSTKRVLSVGETGWFCGWSVDYATKDTNQAPLVCHLLDGIGRRQSDRTTSLTPPESPSLQSQPLSSPRHAAGSQSGSAFCTASFLCPVRQALSGHPLVDTVFGRVGRSAECFSLLAVATSSGVIRLCLDLSAAEWQQNRAHHLLPIGHSALQVFTSRSS
ncbi:WD repeat domain containing protein [Perkinsus marinus ATCC 50983]|uniref:WD repeat domain containing protein n=1 Tax=Perkinsus marinus (strain ATCC 50983 / TXsc) TaxID=423536 RepID=C5K516_PERM5|nr:WD repeat domain containing protein [Perkinsus marinus ATCC 50983]EER20438.1 WD repeat domain containing protein [Perkinsus marinus ATCC 50983]|eukprot:XP_002788642.1 WD repeat domain containing protein [Perkinsus marinus ATCC 50983]